MQISYVLQQALWLVVTRPAYADVWIRDMLTQNRLLALLSDKLIS